MMSYSASPLQPEKWARRNGLSNSTRFTDDGIAATRFERPGFLAIMEKVDVVTSTIKNAVQVSLYGLFAKQVAV